MHIIGLLILVGDFEPKLLYQLGAGIFFGRGVPNYMERKIGDHKIFDDQNVGSHKMTTDSVFILFKKTNFNTILVCLRGKVYR